MSADPTRAEFEAWFTATYGPTPTDEWLLANLAEAAPHLGLSLLVICGARAT